MRVFCCSGGGETRQYRGEDETFRGTAGGKEPGTAQGQYLFISLKNPYFHTIYYHHSMLIMCRMLIFCLWNIRNTNLICQKIMAVCNLGKISNCNFFWQILQMRFLIWKVKLQLNIVNSVQHSMGYPAEKTIETITDILMVSIKAITKFLFIVCFGHYSNRNYCCSIGSHLPDYIPPIESIKCQ